MHPRSTKAMQAENEPTNQEITLMRLEQGGLPPRTAGKGRQARRRVETARQACLAGPADFVREPALPRRLHEMLLHQRPRPRVH